VLRIRDAQATMLVYLPTSTSRPERSPGGGSFEYLDGLDVVQEARSMHALDDPDPAGWGARVAEDAEDARVVGYSMAGPDEEAPGSAHVAALFVAPEAFGTGTRS
jgi:hypothetical protein